MKRAKYVLMLLIVFVLIAMGIGIKSLIHKNKNLISQDSQDSIIVKNNNNQDSIKNKSIDQNTDSISWIKNPATSMYSLSYENKLRENVYEQNQKKYASNVNMKVLINNLMSTDEEQRLNAIRIFELIPENNQIPRIENMLISDSSFTVRIECAKSLRILKSTASIPLLIKASKVDDVQLRLEIALALASLGEKEVCLKMLNDLRSIGERNVILDTHLGYLYLATSDAVEQLKIDLSDNNAFVSVDAAIILAELGYYKEAYPILTSKLSDSDKFIRLAALRGLAYVGNEKSIDLIRNMLNDSEQIVKDRSELILKNCHLNR